MFNRRKRPPICRIVARDVRGKVLIDADEAGFALPEDIVIALSVEYFNDPEPCEIHRAAVRHRAVQQLKEACPMGRDIPVSGLDAGLRRLLPGVAATVRFEERE